MIRNKKMIQGTAGATLFKKEMPMKKKNLHIA